MRRARLIQLEQRLAALRETREIRGSLLHQLRCVPEGAAPSKMARGQFRRDLGGLAPLAAVAGLDQQRQGGTSIASRDNFDVFMAQAQRTSGTPMSDSERADLFRAFLAWSKA